MGNNWTPERVERDRATQDRADRILKRVDPVAFLAEMRKRSADRAARLAAELAAIRKAANMRAYRQERGHCTKTRTRKPGRGVKGGRLAKLDRKAGR